MCWCLSPRGKSTGDVSPRGGESTGAVLTRGGESTSIDQRRRVYWCYDCVIGSAVTNTLVKKGMPLHDILNSSESSAFREGLCQNDCAFVCFKMGTFCGYLYKVLLD